MTKNNSAIHVYFYFFLSFCLCCCIDLFGFRFYHLATDKFVMCCCKLKKKVANQITALRKRIATYFEIHFNKLNSDAYRIPINCIYAIVLFRLFIHMSGGLVMKENEKTKIKKQVQQFCCILSCTNKLMFGDSGSKYVYR